MEKAHEQVQTHKKHWQMSGLPAAEYYPGAVDLLASSVVFRFLSCAAELPPHMRRLRDGKTGAPQLSSLPCAMIAEMCGRFVAIVASSLWRYRR